MGEVMEGFSFPQLLERSGSNVVIISTPGMCPRPGSTGAPFDFPCMSALENISGLMAPVMIPGYDFAGSASARDCKAQVPDAHMTASHWSDSEAIAGSQWARYWMGCVRGCLRTALMTAPQFKDASEVGYWADDSKCVFAVSISGGPITQTEKSLIPGVIAGVLSDLSTRNVAQRKHYVFWLHFETFADFARALSGHGTLDYKQFTKWRAVSGLPCEWIDGPAAEDGNLPAFFKTFDDNPLGNFESAEDLYNFMIQIPPELSMEKKLESAVLAGDKALVQMLLDEGVDPNFKSETAPYDTSLVDYVMNYVARPDIMRMLLKAGAKPTDTPNRNNELWYEAEGEQVDELFQEMLQAVEAAHNGTMSE
eukprot:TRINITY_DN47399_c0_g1_i1.p1 TRINITY_DN47399_c0_g1~~TRINITY_DN47399_c0_g1_i1.p1  ORF type:complete len:366 (+),score=70.53 TRINITY_DN47399_c0_g1_i1:78-1175(+)